MRRGPRPAPLTMALNRILDEARAYKKPNSSISKIIYIIIYYKNKLCKRKGKFNLLATIIGACRGTLEPVKHLKIFLNSQANVAAAAQDLFENTRREWSRAL